MHHFPICHSSVCSWLKIKRDNNFHNQQLHIFNMIQSVKKQSTEIQNVALKNLQNNAFTWLFKNILLSKLKSDELEVRVEAIKKILSIQ